MSDELIKSFKAIEDIGLTKKGSIIQLRKHQSQIPLRWNEMYYESTNTSHVFELMWLIGQIGITVLVDQRFKDKAEKLSFLEN